MAKKLNKQPEASLDQLIDRQEKYMSSLLKQYNYDVSDDFFQNQLNKARQQQLRGKNQSMIQSKISDRRISQIKLPRISSISKRKHTKNHNSDYQAIRAEIESKLSKAYGNSKQVKQFNHNKSRQNKRKKSLKKTKKNKQSDDKNYESFDNQLSQISQPKTPIEIMEKSQKSSQSNDSSQEQIDNIDLKTYHKSLNEHLYNQIKQQMGYLMFNRNESLKDWTENLLMMFQRHDKQLLVLRFKASYLKKFEPAFFQGEADFQS